MNYVLIGKLVNTHALKGEVRIISDFEYKSRVFVPGTHLYIGTNKEEVIIKNYRPHKNFDMCTFNNYDSIESVLKFKGSKVYINREDFIKNEEYIDEDIIGMTAYYKEENIGTVKDIINNSGYKLILINSKYIPFNDNFIDKVDLKNKTIVFKNLEGII